MALVRALRPHRYAAKARERGHEYEIKISSHLRLHLALGWVEEVADESPTVEVTELDSSSGYYWTKPAPVESRVMEAPKKRGRPKKVKVEE